MEPLSADDPQMIGEFRLHARLGAGGMGQVFLGFSPAGRAVAIKVVHTQFARDPEFLERFSREVAAAGSVSGMYTAPVVGSGLSDSPPWLATSFIPGPPLATVVARYGPLPEQAIWKLAAGLAEALRAVHAAGLVHRDLKPANVLLADDGPHVIDFGISRAFQGTALTSAGMVVGTPGYMSPEQAEGLASGPPSDMFSLGCVLAYTATGKAPFGDGSAATILFRVVKSEPDLTAVPARLRPLIEACLKKNPAERPDPSQLIGLIAANRPATTATLGSFWPETVSRVIAAEQAAQTPAGLTPPKSAAAAGPASFAGSGGAGAFAAPAPGGERTPTALATPAPGQALGHPSGGPTPSGTSHAPMISDGYMAAAAQGRAAPGPVIAPLSPAPGSYAGSQPPPYSGQPQGYSGPPQAYPGQQPSGQAPTSRMPAGSGGPTAAGPPSPYPSYAGPGAPGQATPPPWGQQGQPGGQAPWPGGPGLPVAAGGIGAQPYAAGRRNPNGAEIPGAIHTARRLMYAGLAASVAALVFTGVAIGRYGHNATVAKDAGFPGVENTQNLMAGVAAIALIADLLGLACWVIIAVACRRGRGWSRTFGTVLLGIYTVIMLILLSRTHDDQGARFTTLATWVLGLAATIPLYTAPARNFFQAWRNR
jgi:Protein kinase domain